MRKLVIIGDVHGRGMWRDIVEREWDADLFIFLGDYVSTHEHISQQKQLDNLFEILDFKEENPDRVILLRGNHDLQHLGYYWAECSGYFPEVERVLSKPENRDRFLRDTQWLYIEDNIIFSHAGITERWFRDTGCENVEDINSLEPCELFGFRPCKFSDYYGISQTQGITWVRSFTLFAYALPGWTQVVGHTTTKRVINIRELILKEEGEEFDFGTDHVPEIWTCDCLPQEYLVVEDGEFKIKKTSDASR